MIKSSGRPPLPEEVKFIYPIRSYVKQTTFEQIQAIAKKRNLKIAAMVRKMLEDSLEETRITSIIRQMVEESLEEKKQELCR
jgi:predicted DNA-binding ribbon-helix-helix protein